MRYLLAILLLLAWLCSGYWYICIFHDCSPNRSTAFVVKDGNTMVVNQAEGLRFANSSDRPMSTANTDEGIATLAQYLRQNPDRQLVLTGQYDPEEQNNDKKFLNLGLARADEIKQKLLAANAPAQSILVNAQPNKQLAFTDGITNEGIQFQLGNGTDLSVMLPVFEVRDGNNTIYKAKDQLKLKKSTVEPISNPDTDKGIETVAKYLNENPDKELVITGSYGKEEANPSDFNDLGEARANAIKDKMVKDNNAPVDRIKTESKQEGDMRFDQNGLTAGGIALDINSIPTFSVMLPVFEVRDGNNTIYKAKDQLKLKKSTVEPISNPDTDKGIETVAKYLNENPDKELVITGSYGKEEANPSDFNDLGEARADAIKDKMVKNNNAPADRIKTESKQEENMRFDKDDLTTGGIALDINSVPTFSVMLPVFEVKDGDKTLYQAKEQLKLKKSTVEPISNPDTDKGMELVAKYLEEHPDRELIITGSYGKDEKNETIFDDLGEARANAVKDKMVKNNNAPKDRIETRSKQEPDMRFDKDDLATGGIAFIVRPTKDAQDASNNLPGLVVKDGTKVIVEGKDNFTITDSKPSVNTTTDTDNSLQTIANYLKQNNDRQIQVVGHYKSDEENTSTAKNLGLGRADVIARKLVSLGVPTSQILADSKLDNQIAFNGNKQANGGIDLSFRVNKTIASNLVAQKRLLNFDTGNATLDMNEDLRKYFRDVKTYLQQESGKKVQLTGHTDDVGAAESNQQLGLNRAKAVKQQLLRIGIPASAILTASKGESQPIQTNTTEAGRQANRRVEMIVK